MGKKDIKSVLGEYGELRLLRRKTKFPGEKKFNIYAFSYPVKRIFDVDPDSEINFIVVERGDLITFNSYYECDEIESQSLYEALNQMNSLIRNGKFIIDDDKDVCWSCSLLLDSIEQGYIDELVKDYVSGIYTLRQFTTTEDLIYG